MTEKRERVGGFIVTRKFVPSKTIQFETQKETRSKKLENKKVLHPFFITLSEQTADPYWKKILDQCARGKFPTRFSFRKSAVYYRSQGKLFMQQINADGDLQTELSLLLNFFRHHGNLISPEETQLDISQKTESQSAAAASEYDESKESRRREQEFKGDYLNVLLLCFIEDHLKAEYQITGKEAEKIISLIREAIAFREMDESHFVIEKDQIKEIRGISFKRDDSGKLYSYIERKETEVGLNQKKRTNKPTVPKLSINAKINYFSQWKKFVNSESKKNGWCKTKEEK